MGSSCSCDAMCGDEAKMTQSTLQTDLQILAYSDESQDLEAQDSPIADEFSVSNLIAMEFAEASATLSKKLSGEVSFSKASSKKSSNPSLRRKKSREASRSSRGSSGIYWGLKKPEKSVEVSFLMDDREVEDVVYEGELCRVRPELTQQFTSRWVQLTQNEIRYYKNQWNANCWLNKPLFSLPLIQVSDVKV